MISPSTRRRRNIFRLFAWVFIITFIGLLVGYTSTQLLIEKEVKTAVKKAGRDYGATHSDRDCIMASLLSVQHKQTVAAIPKVDRFLAGCLENASGRNLFCGGVPPRDEFLVGLQWRISIAKAFGCASPGCDQIFAEIQHFCYDRREHAKQLY